jgi:hypothetical protein
VKLVKILKAEPEASVGQAGKAGRRPPAAQASTLAGYRAVKSS